jgi:hypothetical protein
MLQKTLVDPIAKKQVQITCPYQSKYEIVYLKDNQTAILNSLKRRIIRVVNQ